MLHLEPTVVFALFSGLVFKLCEFNADTALVIYQTCAKSTH